MYEALHQVPHHKMSGLAHWHLLAVSSDDILEIHIIYDVFGPLFDREGLCSEIDNSIVPSLSILPTEWKFRKKAPWTAFISERVQNLPQVYKKFCTQFYHNSSIIEK